jgi:hypothetical protein
VVQLLVTANIYSFLILFTLRMEAIHSSRTLVLTRAIWRHIPEDGILQYSTALIEKLPSQNKTYTTFAPKKKTKWTTFKYCGKELRNITRYFWRYKNKNSFCTLWSSGHSSWLLRGPGFDSRRYQIFWVAVGLKQGPLSPCEDKWGATWKKSSGSGLENWD